MNVNMNDYNKGLIKGMLNELTERQIDKVTSDLKAQLIREGILVDDGEFEKWDRRKLLLHVLYYRG